MTFQWTEERILEAIAMQRGGMTTYQIAVYFGVSRNAVCGKLFREKARRGLSIPVRRTSSPKPKRKKAMLPTLPSASGLSPRSLPVPVFTPDESQFASIVDVTGCKWPVREDASFVGGHAFCNAATDGNTYCTHHRKEAVAHYSAKLIRKTLGSLGFKFGRKVAA